VAPLKLEERRVRRRQVLHIAVAVHDCATRKLGSSRSFSLVVCNFALVVMMLNLKISVSQGFSETLLLIFGC
jgi:hypothetical protein